MTKFKWEAARKRELLKRPQDEKLTRLELLRLQRAARKKMSTGGPLGVAKAKRVTKKKKANDSRQKASCFPVQNVEISVHRPSSKDGIGLNSAARQKIRRLHEKIGRICKVLASSSQNGATKV
jgi:hypothetical protein